MKGVAVAVVLAALVALAPGAQAAQTRARPTCFPRGSHTLQLNAAVRVFNVRRTAGHARLTYGCLLKRKKPVKFFLPDFPTGYGPIVVAAPYVAYGAYGDCAAAFCNPNSVVVQDLRGGRPRPVNATLSIAEVRSLVLTPKGSAAWIATTFDPTGNILPSYTVAKSERGAPPVALEASADVDPASLALAGSILYWLSAGSARTAALG